MKTGVKIGCISGGSGGPLAPLLAVKEAILEIDPQARFYFFGDNSEPEKRLLADSADPVFYVPSGKLRRYWDWRNLTDLVLIALGFFRALYLLLKLKPDVLFTAGSYVSVPVAYAGSLLKIPVVMHQQDIMVGLANRLVAPVARRITVSLHESLKDFNSLSGLFRSKRTSKVSFTGNPVRKSIRAGSKARAGQVFGLEDRIPILLVLGGGTGAKELNLIIQKSLMTLTRTFQIIHVAGVKKLGPKILLPRYHEYEFLGNELAGALAVADIVISRAGFSTLSEIVALEKISILVPIPHSQQEANALYFFNKGAAIAYPQKALTPAYLCEMLKKLLFDWQTQRQMRKNLKAMQTKGAAEAVAKIVLEAANKHYV